MEITKYFYAFHEYLLPIIIILTIISVFLSHLNIRLFIQLIGDLCIPFSLIIVFFYHIPVDMNSFGYYFRFYYEPVIHILGSMYLHALSRALETRVPPCLSRHKQIARWKILLSNLTFIIFLILFFNEEYPNLRFQFTPFFYVMLFGIFTLLHISKDQDKESVDSIEYVKNSIMLCMTTGYLISFIASSFLVESTDLDSLFFGVHVSIYCLTILMCLTVIHRCTKGKEIMNFDSYLRKTLLMNISLFTIVYSRYSWS